MKLTAQEIAGLVQGTLHASPDILVTGVAGLSEAGPSDVSFVANPKYITQVSATKAGLVLVPEAMSGIGRPLIAVKNPQLAFAKVLEIAALELNPPPQPGIHPSAVVDPSAIIGDGVTVGPCAVIEAGARIGDRTKISAQCFIGRKTAVGSDCLLYPGVTVREMIMIGSRVIIHSGTVLGSDGFGFIPGKSGHVKVPQIGTVEIGDDVEIGANCAIDRATTEKTKIGKGTKLDNLVHIAHNVHVGEHCFIAAQSGIAGSAHLGNFITIAGQAGVIGHVTIGDGVTIASRAGVINSVEAGETISGFPAQSHREELKLQVLVRKLPELYEKIKKIKE